MRRVSCFVVVSFDVETEAQAEIGVDTVDSVLDYVRGAVEETGGKSVSVVLDAVEETAPPKREKSTLGDGFLPVSASFGRLPMSRNCGHGGRFSSAPISWIPCGNRYPIGLRKSAGRSSKGC